jgi:O-antigen biosynthesis protein
MINLVTHKEFGKVNDNHWIICLGGYWNGFMSRRQKFMLYLADKGYRIIFVEPAYALFSKKVRAEQNNPIIKPDIQKISDNITVLKPVRRLPAKNIEILNLLNFQISKYQISLLRKKLGIDKYILWVYNLHYGNFICRFDFSKLIYDMVDDYLDSSYGGAKFENSVYTLLDKADCTIFTSSILKEKYGFRTKKNIVVPNGYDSSLFNADNKHEIPVDIQNINKPVIGFIGSLFKFIDFELVEHIIQDNPSFSFVFIGNWEHLQATRLKLEQYTNYIYLGYKKHEQVPNYINCFDVCINPFKVDDVGNAINPLKVYEYLAMGKPVVSTKIKTVYDCDLSSYIYFAKDKYEFNNTLKTIINNNIINKRIDMSSVKQYSWANLSDQLYKNIFDTL